MDDLTGKLLGDRYRVDNFFGHGGMADVYKVWDQQRAAFLAMKVLHDDLTEDAFFLRRFKREAQVLERLQHPNIVRFYGLEEWDGLAFILMDFIDGLTLRKEIFLNKKGMRPARILQLMQPVCAALHYAHQMGMVHCDIKPANIMVHRNGTVYLADFGIARVIEGRTQSLPSAGTPAYMAPEMIMGGQPTPAADIYALGVVIYEMLTGGERPFSGETAQTHGSTTQRIVWEKNNLDAPPPSRFNRAITSELEAVTLHCLERDPEARFATVMDLSDMLYQAVHSERENLEIQTLVDIHKTRDHDRLPLLRPEWLGQTPPLVQDGLEHENPFPNGIDHYVKDLPGGDLPFELSAQEKEEEDLSAAEGISAENQPTGERALVLASNSLPAVQPTEKKIFPRAWIAAGISGVILLAILFGLVIARPKPGNFPVNAAELIPTWTSQRDETIFVETFTPSPPAATLTPIPAQTSASPAAHPQPLATPLGGGAGQIAFASDRSGKVQIWVMDTEDPSTRRQVTDLENGACQPAWSPDGKQIAFITPCNGPRLTYPGARIKVANLESGEIRDLKLQGGAFDPDWSPDGKTLAFTTFLGSKTEIHAVNVDNLNTWPLSQRGSKNTGPDWSPDGEHLAFTSDEQGVDEIWMMRKDGSSQELLTQAGGLKYFSHPDWSPDGTQLLAGMKEINHPAPVNVLVVFERANPRLGGKIVLNDTLRMEDGVFSPDGLWVVFWTVMEGDNMEIMASSADGIITRLTDHKARDFQPAWRPELPQGK